MNAIDQLFASHGVTHHPRPTWDNQPLTSSRSQIETLPSLLPQTTLRPSGLN